MHPFLQLVMGHFRVQLVVIFGPILHSFFDAPFEALGVPLGSCLGFLEALLVAS